jgi:hypothetical protein
LIYSFLAFHPTRSNEVSKLLVGRLPQLWMADKSRRRVAQYSKHVRSALPLVALELAQLGRLRQRNMGAESRFRWSPWHVGAMALAPGTSWAAELTDLYLFCD